MTRCEAILKKYMAATKKQIIWAGNDGAHLYLTDGSSILKVNLHTLSDAVCKEARTAPQGILLQRKPPFNERWEATEKTVAELEKFLAKAREKNYYCIVDTGFCKRVAHSNVYIYSYNAGAGRMPYALAERYAKILACCDYSAVVRDHASGAYTMGREGQYEFFALPCRLAPDFFVELQSLF